MSDTPNRHPSAALLQAFLDGDVPFREQRRVEEHVASCTQCSEELATWQLLFEDLDGLRSHRPGTDFQARVMAGVQVPEELPWAARAKQHLISLIPGASRQGHLATDLLQDLADGVLGARHALRAREHLEGCPTCARELHKWSSVMGRLSELGSFTPSPGFAARVIAGLRPAETRVPTRRPRFSGVLAGARGLLPRTRRGWAAVSGAAVTPAVTFGLILYTVFSHPALTPQTLASFTFWQLSDLLVAGWGSLVSGGLVLAQSAGLDGLVNAVFGAPLVAFGALTMYALAFVVAVRILYKNLIDRRSIRPHYASAPAS